MSKPEGKRVEFYKDSQGKYRWTQYGTNGKIVDASSEAFHDQAEAKRNWRQRALEAIEIFDDGEMYLRDELGTRIATTIA